MEEDKYDAHPRNRFWSLMNWLLAGDNTRPAYKDGIEILSSHGIALRDSVGSCSREGSLDSEIREIEPNPVDKVLKENPGIRFVFFNGKKSESVFRHIFRQLIAERGRYWFYQSAVDLSGKRGVEFRKAVVCLGDRFPEGGYSSCC
ncbi:MAG: DNA-deoxyinosine glycosylase [Dakarella massiliensis]